MADAGDPSANSMSETPNELEAGEPSHRERRVWATSFGVSAFLHVAAFAGWLGAVIPLSPFAAAGPRAFDPLAGGGGGGGGGSTSNLSIVPFQPVVQASAPEVAPTEAEQVIVAPEPLPTPRLEALAPMLVQPVIDPSVLLGNRPGEGLGTGRGSGSGTGTGTGSGSGSGSGYGSGRGPGRGDAGTGGEGRYRLQPPVPRGMIIPPANRNLKGTSVEVWVFVDEQGKVVPDSTRLNPPTSDRAYNQRLVREAAEWVFQPAIQAGRPVAAWFPYQISM